MSTEGPDHVAPPWSADPDLWRERLDGINPVAMLVRIESRMSSAMKRHTRAEDIWQETQLRAWRDRRKMVWRGHQEFRNWLIVIAENRIRELAERLGTQKRDHQRELSLTPPPGSDGQPFDVPARTKTPSSAAVHGEQAAFMREALEELPEIYREVLRLRLFEEWDRERIATELGLTLTAVKHRFRLGAALYRARLASLISTRTSHARENP